MSFLFSFQNFEKAHGIIKKCKIQLPDSKVVDDCEEVIN